MRRDRDMESRMLRPKFISLRKLLILASTGNLLYVTPTPPVKQASELLALELSIPNKNLFL